MLMFVAPFLVLISIAQTSGHPGGFSGGRASCGTEYSTLKNAFEIADIKEAWYVRRIATCDSPYLWTTFEVADNKQKIYIAANIPEIARFNDNLAFNGILFGPGLAETGEPIAVPKGLDYPTSFNKIKYSQRTLIQPKKYSTCDFLKSNVVMSQYAKVKDGRCTETIELDADYKDPLVAGIEYSAEWLYSVNHEAAKPGRYFLLTWLTDRSTNDVANGKYDLTLGPWTWSRYADDKTQKKMQSQGSTCQCAFNALEWRENSLNRLSDFPKNALIQALPKMKSCSSEGTSVCVSANDKDKLSSNTEIEWSGQFELMADSTYHWNFYAPTGCKNSVCTTEYPDPAIEILFSSLNALGDSIETAEKAADKILKDTASNSVSHNGQISLGASSGKAVPLKSVLTMNNISSTDTKMLTTYQITLPSNYPTKWWMFTQHVPHEFSANFLTCVSGTCLKGGSKYVYPSQTNLYLGSSKYVNNWKENIESATSDGKIIGGNEVKSDGMSRQLSSIVGLLIITFISCILQA
jgi:hypothetical protein